MAPLLRPKRRWRTFFFVSVAMAMYIAANVFWYYISVGDWFGFSTEAYLPDLSVPTRRITEQPLDIYSHPWMIVVSGLLLGLMIWVPLTLSVLYRVAIAVVSLVCLAVFGHAVVLALVLAIGCTFAARTGLRSEMPFLAIMLGMIPVGAYLYLCGYMSPASDVMLPLQRWVKHAPLFIGVVSAILATAATLALVRIYKYSPGVTWPAIVVMLGGCLVIFYVKVGPDELQYALVTRQLSYSPGRGLGKSTDFWDEAFFKEVSLEKWKENHSAEGLNRKTLLSRLEDNLNERKDNLMDKCEEFLRKHPKSDRSAEVLWLEAQCASLQLDHKILENEHVKYVASYPLRESLPYWRKLYQEYKGSPHAALASWRISEIVLRDGEADKAYQMLNQAGEQLRDQAHFGFKNRRLEAGYEVFMPAESLPGSAYYEQALFEVKRLVWLMEKNNVLDNKKSAEALATYLDVNPYKPDYLGRLEKLVGKYESTQMGDNLKLVYALATPDLYEKAGALMVLAEARPPTDASIEANYELGQLAMRDTVLRLKPELKSPEEYFKVVISAPDNPWQQRAAERLAWTRSRVEKQEGGSSD